MNKFQFINAKKVYRELFFQFPRVLMYSPKYKNLSNDAKIAYMILKDRLSYSIKNNWVDEDNNVYFIFTNIELQEILNCGKDKVIAVKKELEKVHLLLQKRMGLNKANRLYLADLEVESTDVYSYQKQENNSQSLDGQGSRKNRLPESDTQTLTGQGSRKNRLPENETQSLDGQGSRKNRHNLDINNYILDTYLDTLQDTVDCDEVNLEKLSAEIEQENTNPSSGFPESAKKIILQFEFNDHKKVYENIGIILRAKAEVAKKYKQALAFEDVEEEFLKATRTIFNEIYKSRKGTRGQTISNEDNYIYKSFERFFGDIAYQMQQLKERKTKGNSDFPDVLIDYTNYL